MDPRSSNDNDQEDDRHTDPNHHRQPVIIDLTGDEDNAMVAAGQPSSQLRLARRRSVSAWKTKATRNQTAPTKKPDAQTPTAPSPVARKLDPISGVPYPITAKLTGRKNVGDGRAAAACAEGVTTAAIKESEMPRVDSFRGRRGAKQAADYTPEEISRLKPAPEVQSRFGDDDVVLQVGTYRHGGKNSPVFVRRELGFRTDEGVRSANGTHAHMYFTLCGVVSDPPLPLDKVRLRAPFNSCVKQQETMKVEAFEETLAILYATMDREDTSWLRRNAPPRWLESWAWQGGLGSS